MLTRETEDLASRLQHYNLERLVQEQRLASKNKLHRLSEDAFEATRPKLLTNYVCELEVWTDVSVDPSLVTPSPQLDAQLFSVWREIVSRTVACGGNNIQAHSRRRTFSDQTSSSTQNRSAGGWLNLRRLRSSSFSTYTNS